MSSTLPATNPRRSHSGFPHTDMANADAAPANDRIRFRNPAGAPHHLGATPKTRTSPTRRSARAAGNAAAAALLALAFSNPIDAARAAIAHPLADASNYQLHPGLELTVFAREPDVVDPVALAFDEFGRAYVVEMRDYPYGFGSDRKPGGTIRMLEDTDGDGRADRSQVYAEGLSFPTSVAAWNDGILVMAPPEILHLRDTDGDGKSDRRDVLIGGLALGVTDSNANGLRWALDNQMHAVNGGNGGTLTAAFSRRAPVRLGDRDFRFDPRTGTIELTSHTGGGFGLVFDDWGRSFTPHNVNHLQQRVADLDPFLRVPGLPPIETTHSISDHGEMARIHAISTAVTRPNHPEQAGYFSSAGSIGILAHRGWPDDLPGSVFVCDVVGNLVHRDVLSPDGPVLKGSRAPSEQTREFFASRDQGFRPTGVELGPDGALYLLDMQRDVIEHPDYIPNKLLDSLDLRAGDDRGRIYRIAPKHWPKTRELPGTGSTSERVALLGSSNQWTRLAAQRVIVTRGERAAIPGLRRLLSGTDPLAALHALRTLEGLGAAEVSDVLSALGSDSAGLRANAIQLGAARFPKSRVFGIAVARHVEDDDAFVRFHGLLAAGALVRPPPIPPILATFWRDRSMPWMRRAALAALRDGDESRAIGGLLEQPAIRSATDSHAIDAIRDLADLTGARPAATDGRRLVEPLRMVLEGGGVAEPLAVAFLDGLLSGLDRSGKRPTLPEPIVTTLRTTMKQGSPRLLAASWRIARRCQVPDSPEQHASLSTALRVAKDSSAPTEQRLDAIRLLGLAEFDVSGPVLLSLLDAREPLALHQAAFDLLRNHREPAVGQGLAGAWPSLPPSLRAPTVNLLVYRSPFHPALLEALESGRIQVGELNLDLEHRRQLLRRASPEIRTRAAKFTSDEEYSNRKSIVAEWLGQLPATGDAARGRALFERVCAQCHKVGDLGFRVGPDLTGMKHRSVEDLVSNILDPNMAMNPAYLAFTAELDDGESESGIPVAESTDAVTLAQAGERRVTIPRTRIRRFQSDGKSLMPDGLEAGMTPAELRDLVAFLQADPP